MLKVGIILQRSALILMLACFPCWAILVNTEVILLAVRQEAEVARSVAAAAAARPFSSAFPRRTDGVLLRLAQLYVKIFMPALPVSTVKRLSADCPRGASLLLDFHLYSRRLSCTFCKQSTCKTR